MALLWSMEWTFGVVYHWKYHVLVLYFTCLCPNSMLVCWDKVLQRLWFCCHCLTSCNMNALKEKMRGEKVTREEGLVSQEGREGGMGENKG